MHMQVAQIEELMRHLNGMPHCTIIQDLIDKFNASTERFDKIHV